MDADGEIRDQVKAQEKQRGKREQSTLEKEHHGGEELDHDEPPLRQSEHLRMLQEVARQVAAPATNGPHEYRSVGPPPRPTGPNGLRYRREEVGENHRHLNAAQRPTRGFARGEITESCSADRWEYQHSDDQRQVVVVHLAVGHPNDKPFKEAHRHGPPGKAWESSAGGHETGTDQHVLQNVHHGWRRRRKGEYPTDQERLVELWCVPVRDHIVDEQEHVNDDEQVEHGAQQRDPGQRHRSRPPTHHCGHRTSHSASSFVTRGPTALPSSRSVVSCMRYRWVY